MKKVLLLIFLLLTLAIFYFWGNKGQERKGNPPLAPDIYKGVDGVRQLKDIQEEQSSYNSELLQLLDEVSN